MDAKFYIKGLNKSSNNNSKQNYIIDVYNPNEPTVDEKRTIAEKVEEGIILDCIISSASDTISKILACDKTSKLVFYSDATADGIIRYIEYGE